MIITLCGSARFERLFHRWNEALTLSGHVVFGLAVYPSLKEGKHEWYTLEEKRILDTGHFAKIAASDAIVVLNRFAYVGPSTLNEIRFAIAMERRLFSIESWGKGYGIGPNHKKSYREQCAKEKVPEGFKSPIDTTSIGGFGSAYDLLTRDSESRNELVNRLKEGEKYDG